MSDENKEKQLVLFEGEPVPESRAKALAKIERQHGKDAAIQRNTVYNFYGSMREKITEKTASDARFAIISRQKAINRAAGIEGINKCPPEKYGTVIVCVNTVINGYEIEDAKKRSLFIKNALQKVAEMEAAIKDLFTQHTDKRQERKAA